MERSFNTVSTAVKSYESGRVMQALVKAEGYRFAGGALDLLMERSDQVLDAALGNYNKLKAISDGQEISWDLVDRNIDLSLDQNVFCYSRGCLKRGLPRGNRPPGRAAAGGDLSLADGRGLFQPG